MPILVLGLSHREASAAELAAFTAAADRVLGDLLADFGVRGAIRLATCNRYEVYVDADRHHPTERAFRALLAAAGEPASDLFVRRGRDAARHLFEVAAGLDSMVLGESEIIGQVRRALTEPLIDHVPAGARRMGRSGTPTSGSEPPSSTTSVTPRLRRLFDAALAASKDVTARTNLRRHGRSVASVALDLCEREHGPLAGRRVVLLGTGAFAGVVTADLQRRGALVDVFSTSGRAAGFAAAHGVEAPPDDSLVEAVTRAAAVVSCSGTGHGLLGEESLARALAGRVGVLPVVDLVPGGDVAVAGQAGGVDLIDLDRIGAATPEDVEPELAGRLVAAAVEAYLGSERARRADPAVVAVRSHVEGIIEKEVADVAAAGDPVVAEAVARSLRRVANELLHRPSTRAQTLAADGQLADYTSALETMFGLQVEGT